MADSKRSNRLAAETSPYLLQHAENPVDWYPWGEEALAEAKKRDCLIFLSIGYSACHWCHVMERESFEDEETAKLLNEKFVNIKVDREERPDIDAIYMTAVQVMTRHGGWPLSVFLTPEGKPVYGGTYFPPEDKMGMPSFKKIIQGVAVAWETKRDEVMGNANQMGNQLAQIAALPGAGDADQKLNEEDWKAAMAQMAAQYDPTHGGFGKAPKFFHVMDLKLCLRYWKRTGDKEALERVTQTLEKISQGGIYDHLAGGFHRYSTDAKWLVPHFEKMLYDNALLAQLYLEAYQATRTESFSVTAREILDCVSREMTSPEGGFYSTVDADSEGVEGKYYVWSQDEIEKCLGDRAKNFCQVYQVSDRGNWEGSNILHRTKTWDELAASLKTDSKKLQEEMSGCRADLLKVRGGRVAPLRDEKILVAWNGMMIEAFAMGAQILGEKKYEEVAQEAAAFVIEELSVLEDEDPEGEFLFHSYKDGKARFSAYLDDYAFFIHGLTALYQADFDERWLNAAGKLADQVIEHFRDDSRRNFFYTGKDHEKLLVRTKEVHDGATPSANAMVAESLIQLGRLIERTDYIDVGYQVVQSVAKIMTQTPLATGQMWLAWDDFGVRPAEVAIVAGDSEEETAKVLNAFREKYLPGVVFLLKKNEDTNLSLLKEKKALQGHVTAYICENFKCRVPVSEVDEVLRVIDKL